ncbi:SDR family oxidoreductase [Streptomyces sp. TRM 70361]|uniref:SDR family oxidoreductase n=1 Tax=Streptomyces sp. TRM 70361 TaxID=3116553 RepID=UPI002E7B163C|nr:SDR family oxidoreductase [Streptomyces sp. TRM 70361]MEE1943178.1 SDR family oxidoreductase [Streptomyces sp. TRM 70361]
MTARRTILITGASSGLGEQMARDFAALGRDLALCARRTDRLERLREELLAAHPGITVAVRALDVTDHDRVFTVFRAFRDDLGGRLDRVIVNAGLGKGQPVGTGRFDANLHTVRVNLDAALAQCEAAVEIFRAQNAGHLVVVSSMSAMRGLPRNLTAYAASKAGVATLAEGIRAELLRTPIKVTTLFPGFIASEMSSRSEKAPLTVSTEKGVRAMVRAVEAERARAEVPAWPWVPIGFAMRHLPLRLVAKVT